MNTPLYTVVVTSLTRGWSYEATHGDTLDHDDLPDSVLIDPLDYAWSFEGGVLPSYMEPTVATVNLAAKSATLVPEVQIGDLITIDVRVGTTGARIIAPPPMRAAEPSVTLIKHRTYPARLEIPLSDLTVDWRARPLAGSVPPPPGDDPPATMRRAWRERLAEYGYLIGLSVGCPTTWDGTERPPHPSDPSVDAYVLVDYPGNAFAGYPGTAIDAFVRTLNSHHPDGHVHVPVPYYGGDDFGDGHPTGYEYVEPDTYGTSMGAGAIPEPESAARIELVPASRYVDASAGLPLTFEVIDGLLSVVPVEPPSGDVLTQLGLDGGWCVLPVTARRSREAVINTVAIEGTTTVEDPPGEFQTEVIGYSVTDWPDADARGITQRDVPMDLYIGDPAAPYPGVGAAMLPFFSDESAREAPWCFDSFEVRSSKIPQDIADWLLPLLAPRLPDETDGDGRLVRHVTIFDIEGTKRFDGQPVTGFVVAGSMTVANGEITWVLTTVPGEPQFTGGTPAAITVGDVDGASYQAQPVEDIDPLITVADLAHIAA